MAPGRWIPSILTPDSDSACKTVYIAGWIGPESQNLVKIQSNLEKVLSFFLNLNLRLGVSYAKLSEHLATVLSWALRIELSWVVYLALSRAFKWIQNIVLTG